MDMIYSAYFDLKGNPVERTMEKYPYSYDPFVVWKKDYNEKNSRNVYSDRLVQWNHEKFNEACLNVWGNKQQVFHNRKPKDIEKFLINYLDKNIKLTAITEGCNVSNGYPFWVFYYEELE